MLIVTEAAIDQLSEMLDRTDADGTQGIRLVENRGELALRVDVPHQDDQVVEAGERPVLLIDANLSTALDGATLDALDMPQGKQLTLLAPDADADTASSGNGAR